MSTKYGTKAKSGHFVAPALSCKIALGFVTNLFSIIFLLSNVQNAHLVYVDLRMTMMYLEIYAIDFKSSLELQPALLFSFFAKTLHDKQI